MQDQQGRQSGQRPAQSQQRESDEPRIPRRAHEIWVDEGEPEGRAHHCRLRAKWELEQASNGPEAVVKLRPVDESPSGRK